jgi:SAM-dependent methyltransferase
MQSADTHSIYDDPVAYDLMFQSADISFYLQQHAGDRGSVLELGCGTGRVAIPLAEHGYTVTGIDMNEQMLSLARAKAAAKNVSIDWVLGDVRNFDLGKQYDTILFPANSITHLLDTQSIEACLACVRKHLSENGLFILRMFNPVLECFTRDPNQRYPISEYDDPNGKGHVVVTENNIYDRARQVNEVKWYYLYEETGEQIIKNISMRIFYPQELDMLLRYNGFEIIHKYGRFDGSPFTSESPCQIPVCRKR